MIAIKEITHQDEEKFEEFLKSERRVLPDLKVTELPFPHEAVVIVVGIDNSKLTEVSKKNNLEIFTSNNGISVLSKNRSFTIYDNIITVFSGYLIFQKKLVFGFDEFSKSNIQFDQIDGCYGEFVATKISNNEIELISDYFGMSPLFYYNKNGIFCASNHYHLMLEILHDCEISLSMNIERSSVNLITSGYTYGSAFTKQMDVENCYVTLPFETLKFNLADKSLAIQKTDLFDIISSKEAWNEDRYEQYLNEAKKEIFDNTYAFFNHPRFKNIVVDVSGGFDSRIVYATVNNLPKKLRNKVKTFTRNSGTKDDVEKANYVTNVYRYPKHTYVDTDTSDIFINNKLNISQISRTLGFFSVNNNLYLDHYDDISTLQLTGGLGDAVFGYKRIRGELKYEVGEQKLLSWLGGSYIYNSVKQFSPIFKNQAEIINNTINGYNSNDLFKKFHVLYINFRNRFNFGNAHNIEYNNFRATPLHSKAALKAKWMYFNRFNNNVIPDEKISIDLLTKINPLLACLPFADNNKDVLPNKNNLLLPQYIQIKLDKEEVITKSEANISTSCILYKEKALQYMDNLNIAEQMILHIYDYSKKYHTICLGLYKLLQIFKNNENEFKTGHGREQIRKIYDVFYQIQFCK